MKKILIFVMTGLTLFSCKEPSIKVIDGRPLDTDGKIDNIYGTEKFKSEDTVIFQITKVTEIDPACPVETFYLYDVQDDAPDYLTAPKYQTKYDVPSTVTHGNNENHKTRETISYYRSVLYK